MTQKTVSAPINPDFRYWNSVDPASFLDHDWQNPSRQWATREAIKAAKGGTLLEVGPGQGLDYERYFRKSTAIHYVGVEGSQTFYDSLRQRFPDATWKNEVLTALEPLSADVVYARHVMEHQPQLQPALGTLLGAARHAVVLTWYRPPGPVAFHEVWNDVYCQTYARAAVLKAVAEAGFVIAKQETFAPIETAFVTPTADEAWLLRRQ